MGRYIGPSCKKCRRSRAKLFLKGERCFTAKCEIDKRNFPPGPRSSSMRKISEYGKRLREKQKLRFYYGVSEKQMQNYFEKAARQKGMTGENLLSLFERRIDNIIYRSHQAASRKNARQLVRHGHFTINDKKITAPSYIIKESDTVQIKEKSRKAVFVNLETVKERGIPAWMAFNKEKTILSIEHLPKRTEIDVPVEEQLIVEFYSR